MFSKGKLATKLFTAAATIIASLVGTAATASAQPAAKAQPPAPMSIGAAFQIINRGTNKCLDVARQSLLPGAQVWQWRCDPNDPNDNWLAEPISSAPGYVTLRNLRSNLCLDLAANSEEEVGNSTPAQQYVCVPDSVTSERWQLVPSNVVPGYLTIVNWVKGMCLDLNNGSSSNGAKIQVWQCVGPINNQLWRQG